MDDKRPWKLIRGICWIILSVGSFIYTFDGPPLQNILFGAAIALSISVTRDGWKEYELIKNK